MPAGFYPGLYMHGRWTQCVVHVYRPVVLCLSLFIFVYRFLFNIFQSRDYIHALIFCLHICCCFFCVAVPVVVERHHGSSLSGTLQEEEEEGWKGKGEEVACI